MGLFGITGGARREDKLLGTGVWRRAHDRFGRGLDRFHQVLEGIESDELYNALVVVANELAELQPRLRAVCQEAQRVRPSSDFNIPGGPFSPVHRALSRAANDLATAAQAAAMARLDAERLGLERGGLENVGRRAEAVAEGVHEAEAALAEALSAGSRG
ncbi:hypothetical protein ACQ3I4_11795 [Zafaria sp. Z1313]|uniref:hypothetical protein n=1 Tax=unclassified Zafaria TaxID=2828765 RepID=UPI002E75FEDE|nr:hypothetical protein [Zafaria sp. J156]MEE1622042.1 hypothetical protein [Zafaria sp. J156]